VVATDTGNRVEHRRPLPVEDWNAQLSLLTGRAAAALMLEAGVGVLRTMPAPSPRDERRLRRVAAALGIDWPDGEGYGRVLAALPEPSSGRVVAFLNEAAELYRGAAYVAFAGSAPTVTGHAAIGAPYTHCTAPIRRLVDRFAAEVCLAAAADRAVPDWVLGSLPELPDRMLAGRRRVGTVERESLDAVERAVLEPYRGTPLPAVVIDVRDERRGEVAVREPAVIGSCRGRLALGEGLRVVLDTDAADADQRVRFVRADSS
jgi:exoribonuclease R